MTPTQAQSPEHQAKLAARETFKAARAQWVAAKARIRQINSAIESGEVTGEEKDELVAEKRALKASLASLGEATRSTKATWQALKSAANSEGTAE